MLLVRLLVVATVFAVCSADGLQAQDLNRFLVNKLRSLEFLSTGTTEAADNITLFTQCSGFSEGYEVWTVGSPRPYAYRVDSDGFLHAPEVGIRSAVPLGGLGTGSFELRGDGTFADWTIENQGTSLASDYVRNSKIPIKDEAFLALFVEGFDGAVSLRLQPPEEIANTGVAAMSYSGAFPFTRLSPSMRNTSAGVYAYSPFKLYDSTASNIPAVVFSLVITNPSPTRPTNVSFMLSLPLGGSKDTDRPLGAGPAGCGIGDGCDPRNQTIRTIANVSSAEDCVTECGADSDCIWWRYSGNGAPAVPEKLIFHHDCPGNDLLNSSFGTMWITTPGLQACIDYCLTLPLCDWVMYDDARHGPFDAKNFCGPSADLEGHGCCFPKLLCPTPYAHNRYNFTSWGKPKPAQPARECTLYRLAPAVETFYPPNPSGATRIGPQLSSPRSGVKGVWEAVTNGLRHVRNNSYDDHQSATVQDPASATADYTLLSADAENLDPSVAVTTTSRRHLSDLWSDFAGDGRFSESDSPSNSNMFGAIAASATLAPGETKALTIVFSWHLRHRLYVGQDLGNFYATHLKDSLEAARSVSSRLVDVVSDGAAWNALATNNSYPRAFADFVVNSLATQVKMAVWVSKDSAANATLPRGRFRQFEAFSNCDLDPVHVSSYHMIPYATFWPDVAQNTLVTGWAGQQLPNGMIQETLGSMSSPFYRLTGFMDISAGGRVMADTTTVFILYAHAAFLSAGDLDFLNTIYPNLVHAAQWQINTTKNGINGSFPSYLQNTYDYLGLNEYPAQAYTGFLHLAAMRSMRALATVMGDSATARETLDSEALVADAMQGPLLWAGSFFRAFQNENYTAPDITMAGSLHGQSWAHMNNLGFLLPEDQLRTHLDAEFQQNCLEAYDPTGACVFGLLPLGLLPEQSTWAQDGTPSVNMDHTANVVWLAHDNASFLLSALPKEGLRQDRKQHLHPALAVIDLYRDTLHDMWNWHDLHVGPFGLTCTGDVDINGTALSGTPFVNAHYARQLQGWAIVRALAGLQWSAHDRTLTLEPPSVVAYFLSSSKTSVVIPFFAGGASGQLVLQLVAKKPLQTSLLWSPQPWLRASLSVLAGRLLAMKVKIGVLSDGREWKTEMNHVDLSAGGHASVADLVLSG
jgi:uncharacterized protein (DUF608 family)